jgi:3-oxoadipate enol-lactonase
MSLELLSAHPTAFAGAVLTSAMPMFDFTLRLKAEHWAHCLEVGGPLMQFDAVAPYLWGDRFLEARHGVLRAYHQVVTGNNPSPHRNLHQIRGALGWDIRDRLSHVAAPVLLLCGAEDLLTPPWKCQETARLLPGSVFEVVPGVGHAYPVEDPRAFSARVRAFVEGIEGLASRGI